MNKYLLSCCLFLIAFSSCERFDSVPEADTFFHVKIDGAELPVWVKGNTASEKLIIFINGGPGLTTLDIAEADLLGWSADLEEEFAMVYYDQRGTGNVLGNLDPATINMAQYVKDLDAIVEVLLDKYNSSKVFLLGHSYGGYIGANYLMTGENQEKIAGWISVDGAYNFDLDARYVFRREFLINIANEEIAKGNRVEHWQEALDWVNDNSVIETREQRTEWRRFIGDPGEIILPDEQLQISFKQILQVLFTSSYNPLPAYFSDNLFDTFLTLIQESEDVNLTNQIGVITLPSLFVQGRYDDLITPEESQAIFDNYGTDSLDKEYALFLGSGHEPFLHEPELFKETVLNFVRKY